MVKIARWHAPATTETRTGPRVAHVHTGIVHKGRALSFEPDVTTLTLLEEGLAATLRRAAARIAAAAGDEPPVEQVRFLAPLEPRSMRDFVTFEEHVEGVTASIDGEAGVVDEWYEAPTFYFTNPHTVRADGETIPVPSGCHRMDFELEVAAVIGAPAHGDAPLGGTNLDPARAHEFIFGYTILNDWSARDVQSREMKVRLGPCKGKDFANTLGPWIVTADEFADRHDEEGFLHLALTAEVNGTALGTDDLGHMGWPFAELVAYASQDSRVLPGDVLGSGTSGRGCLAELWGRHNDLVPPPLAEGDRVRLTVEGIGSIENTVGARRREGVPSRPARRRGRSRAPETTSEG
ncbi:fumarylacetoacetate hydrolase family protein [Saxibacter everestensis]|uniref:Fumarylacetoacetate hydrolase family protein n=1 Tax=Saxibacter everestensis TaxID=2909229 RepID=A0ABY8QUH4_9MICO|nr:fumarylacetoacetate hydrolase family protein [Brevibacteriaceae bacterium ZFBP1038]